MTSSTVDHAVANTRGRIARTCGSRRAKESTTRSAGRRETSSKNFNAIHENVVIRIDRNNVSIQGGDIRVDALSQQPK